MGKCVGLSLDRLTRLASICLMFLILCPRFLMCAPLPVNIPDIMDEVGFVTPEQLRRASENLRKLFDQSEVFHVIPDERVDTIVFSLACDNRVCSVAAEWYSPGWENLIKRGQEPFVSLKINTISDALNKVAHQFIQHRKFSLAMSQPRGAAVSSSLRDLCTFGNSDACAILAYVAERKNKEKEAIGFFQEACKQGDISSCTNYGYKLSRGEGITADKKAANKIFDSACDRGDDRACHNLTGSKSYAVEKSATAFWGFGGVALVGSGIIAFVCNGGPESDFGDNPHLCPDQLLKPVAAIGAGGLLFVIIGTLIYTLSPAELQRWDAVDVYLDENGAMVKVKLDRFFE